jgi:DNA-binding FrmR family transcriptional regulator
MNAINAEPRCITDKRAVLIRLLKIEGQVRGLERMVDSDASCIDVLTQVAAATRALQSVALTLLDEHMHRCVAHATLHPRDDTQPGVDEAMSAITRLVRS